jgi:ABC-type lipoprotein export system ATPase subunit
LNLLGLLDRPTEGSYRIAGQDVLGLDPDQRADVRNRRIGFVSRPSICSPAVLRLKMSSCL